MQGSGLKEKKHKKSLFKESIHFVKSLRGKKSEKTSVEEQEEGTHLTQEQKEYLLPSKTPSDEAPLDSTIRRQPYASTSEPRFIKLSSGAVVDRPSKSSNTSKASVDQSSTPVPPPPWSSSSSGFGVGLMADHQGQRSALEARKPHGDLDLEAISYDTLLKEARMLREDLETEYNRNRGSKEELENQITEAKIKIAEVQSNKPSDQIYDDIIVLLSRELTELEKKVSEIESRMNPLDHTISDIQSVERFIKDRELDSQQASMLFETIMKKMFDDLSRGGPSSNGEAVIGVETIPKNVLNELQTKIQGQDWIPFDQDQDQGQESKHSRISNLESNELMTKRKKLAREKFQRFSMKMDKVVEFSHKRTKNQDYRRSVAFRFNAIDRGDALRNPVSYMPSKSKLSEDEEASTISRSVFSDKTSRSNALQSIDGSLWLGYDQQKLQKLTGSVKVPSDRGESLRSSRSVADLQSLEHYPGVNLDASFSGDPKIQKPAQTSTSNDLGKPPLAPTTSKSDTVQGEGSGKEPMTTNDSLSEALSNIKLKKASDRPPSSVLDKKLEIPPMELDEIDLGALADALAADTRPEPNQKTQSNIQTTNQAKTESQNEAKTEEKTQAKEETKIKEKTEVEEKSEVKKPPPPPPRKAPPPPPPPGKKKPGAKGGPPAPPGGKKKTSEGLTRAPEVIAMFQEMRKALLGSAANSGGGAKKLGGGVADPGALMDELAKNSKYAAQVQADIEKYGERIPQLITEVSNFEAKSMSDLIEFVKRVDSVLSELSDETAVLKQFDWPQRYYTMLEAKGVYEELERMKRTFSPWKKTENKAAAEIQKIQKFMDKSKTRVDVILRTKDADEKKFKDNKIPWNGKIFTEVKIASLSPLIVYMEVVLEEVESLLSSAPDEEGPIRTKALEKSLEHLRGAITFAFKVHQFAGGFTEACSSRFAEISVKTREIRNEIGGGPTSTSATS